jgi:hypothetical protein
MIFIPKNPIKNFKDKARLQTSAFGERMTLQITLASSKKNMAAKQKQAALNSARQRLFNWIPQR